MRLVLTLFLFSLSSFAVLATDVGDGSDGACTAASFLVGKRSYQCTTLILNAPVNVFKGAGGAGVVIKVQGFVNINGGGSIDVSGNNGADGSIGAIAAGGTGGPGGFSGGSSTVTNGANGSGAGAGIGGNFSALGGGAISVGAGGGGGTYKVVSAVTALDGDSNGSSTTAGANGATYGAEANFDTSFLGGSGGGAGGTGIDGATPDTWFGSGGGGGGGTLRIVSGGDITIDGSLISNGGNGGGAGTEISSGGGGGASGGAIWLQSQSILTVNGTINAIGGTKGTNVQGFVGVGGGDIDAHGRIRLDDADGVISGTGIVTPAPYSTTFTPTSITSGTSAVSRQYASSITCARVVMDENQLKNFVGNFCVGILLVSFGVIVFARANRI